MIIDCISDLHGFYPELEGGDLLIIGGDCTKNDSIPSWNMYFDWLDKQNYRKKIMIAGNHDNFCAQWAISNDSVYDALLERPSVSYLCDSGEEFEGLKIWGSPWTKTFDGMNPKCKAFTCETDEELAKKWALIPENTDILITHCPPYDYLDHIKNEFGDRISVGSLSLYDKITDIFPKIHIFGHIHEGYGKELQDFFPVYGMKTTLFVNASHVNERYEPVNKPIRIEL